MPAVTSDIIERHDPFAAWPDNATIETRGVLKACIRAHRALAVLERDRQRQPMPGFDRVLMTLNLVGAWQLAGTPLNARDVLADEDGASPAGLHRLVQRLQRAADELDRLPIGRVLALDLAGAASDEQVCVRRSLPATSHCQALALRAEDFPHGSEHLQRLLDDWESRLQYRSTDLDPLVLLAMSHARYLAISAFSSANIVSTHALDAVLPVEEGVLPAPVLTLAWYLSRRADNYRQAVRSLYDGDVERWVSYLLHAIEQVAIEQVGWLTDLRRLRQELREDIIALLPRQADHDAVTDVCLQPVCTIADLVDRAGVKRHAAGAYLSRLQSAGLLILQHGGRSRRYVNARLMQCLLDV